MEDSGARRTSGTRARAASLVLVLMAVPLLSSCGGDGVDLPSATGSLTATGLPSVTGSLPDRTRSPSREESEPPTTESSPSSDPTTTEPAEPTEPESSTPTSEPPTSPTSIDTTPATTTPSEATSATPSKSPKDKDKDKAKGKDAAEDDGVPPWVWWLLAAAGLAAAALAAFLIPRARRRKAWAARLEGAEAEATWFARELLPQLQQAASPDEVAGGWQVASGRVVAAEDELTGLATTAPDEPGRARADQLRDAVRTARGGVEGLLVSRDPATFRRELAAIAAGIADALSPPATQA